MLTITMSSEVVTSSHGLPYRGLSMSDTAITLETYRVASRYRREWSDVEVALERFHALVGRLRHRDLIWRRLQSLGGTVAARKPASWAGGRGVRHARLGRIPTLHCIRD
jgi:hypothetical protein